MSQQIIDRVTHLVTEFDKRVQAAPAGAWGNASPCEGWTARDVVVHVGNNLKGLTASLTGAERTEIAADEDIVAAWNTTRTNFFSVLTTADLSASVNGPFGPMPAADLLGRLVANDVLVHTWDLARAVGGDERLDQEMVQHAYSGMKPMDDMIRRPGVFGPKIMVDGADVQTEFLSFLGRAV